MLRDKPMQAAEAANQMSDGLIAMPIMESAPPHKQTSSSTLDPRRSTMYPAGSAPIPNSRP